jgi:hypothetical protein
VVEAPARRGLTAPGEVTSREPVGVCLLEAVLAVEETEGLDLWGEGAAAAVCGGIDETRRCAVSDGGRFSGVPARAAAAEAELVVVARFRPVVLGAVRRGAAAAPGLDGGFCRADVRVVLAELLAAAGRVLEASGRRAVPLTRGFRVSLLVAAGLAGEALGGRADAASSDMMAY